jgi:hypothetical protein
MKRQTPVIHQTAEDYLSSFFISTWFVVCGLWFVLDQIGQSREWGKTSISGAFSLHYQVLIANKALDLPRGLDKI